MLRILIIDGSESVRTYLTRRLGEMAQVVACDTDVSVLDQVYSLEPDIIMLDMMLQGQDALEVLQAVRSSGRKTLVLATFDNASEFIRARLQRLQLTYTMTRPYRLTALAARLREMISFAQDLRDTWLDDKERVNDLMFTLGMHLNKSGYPCIREALVIMMEKPDVSMTKELYPRVAVICGGSDKRVERAIRSDIERAWGRRDRQVWQLYFSPDELSKSKCPSNGDFLDRLATCLRREKKIV